ncbi:hypothetical protein EON65_05735, partial [archaeon]
MSRNTVLHEFSEVRKEYLIMQADAIVPAKRHAPLVPSHIEHVVPMIDLIEEETHLADEKQRILHHLESTRSHRMNDMPHHDDSIFLKRYLEEDADRLHLLKLSMREETMRLSLHNVTARVAYMHRISILVEYISTYKHVFKSHSHRFSFPSFLYNCMMAFVHYVVDTIALWKDTWRFCVDQYRKAITWSEYWSALWKVFIKAYGVGMKVSLAASITSTLLLYNAVPFLYQKGLWMTLVTFLIKQDLASSSLLTSIQRIEGTVVGVMYSYFIHEVFSCGTVHCGYWVNVPAIVIWIALCGVFREGPQHGYSAYVAAFTPIIILLGTNDTEQGAWGRIEETFLGIVVYLAVDNLVMPQRTAPAIATSVLNCINVARQIFSESVKGVETFVKIENVYSADGSSQLSSDLPATPEDEVGMYGAAADVRLRVDSITYEIMEGATRDRRNTSVLLRTMAHDGDVEMPSIMMTNNATSKAIQELLERCTQHFHDAEQKLRCMKTELTRQATLLNLV